MALPALFARLALACGEVNVTVASPAQPEGGTGRPCSTNDDCGSALFCEKESCTAALGTCTDTPVKCPLVSAPVCGCDGVNYWNDCLRERDGVFASTPNECGLGAISCVDQIECPPVDAVCDRVSYHGQCTLAITGVCRVLPDSCPEDGGPALFVRCNPDAGIGGMGNGNGEMGSGGTGHGSGGGLPEEDPPACTTLCAAIQTGLAYGASRLCR